MVRPFATVVRVIEPGRQAHVGLFARQIDLARAAPACGTGSTNERAPGPEDAAAPPHSSVSANGPGPAISALERLPVGDQRHAAGPPAVASISVAPLTAAARG